MKTMNLVKPLLILFLSFISIQAFAQEPPAYSWLSGSWTGDGFGGTSEESWSAPSTDGTMMGMYRHHNADGSLNFYEFLILDENGLRLKHFTPNLEAWEEKADYLTFEMIQFDEKTIELKGLKFQLIEPDSMEIYLEMKAKEGSRTEVFHMRRVDSLLNK